MESEFYRHYLPRFSISELWRCSTGPFAFLNLLCVKLFRIDSTPYNGMGVEDRTITPGQLPEDARSVLSPLIEECRQLGFVDEFVKEGIHLGRVRSFEYKMISPDQYSIVMISYVDQWQGTRNTRIALLMIVSELENGEILLTTNNGKMLDPGHPIRSKRVNVQSAGDLYRAHNQRCKNLMSRQRIINDPRGFSDRCSKELVRGLVQRRVVIPLTDKQKQLIRDLDEKFGSTQLESKTPETEPTPGVDQTDSELDAHTDNHPDVHPEDAQVLRQIDVQQKHSSSWVTKIALLVISLAMFAALGALAWNLELLLLLIPVLFFHELGHYVAMRVLKYKDVKMFFLPLMGAAVSGRSHNAPGWQRAVVALAGPIPGIVVAVAIVFLMPGDPFWTKIVMVTLCLNALNLLPFLPLDGGWVVQTTLFARNLCFDYFFRVLATLVLGGIGIWLREPILIAVGAFVAIGLPFAWKVCNVTAKLKREGLRPDSDHAQELCPETIHEIVKRVRTETEMPINNRPIAAVGIYEALGSRPPGWFVSLCLLGLQTVAFFGSLFFALWILTGGRLGAAGEFDRPAPTTPVTVSQIKVAETPATLFKDKKGSLCITFPDEQQAAMAALQLAKVDHSFTSRFGQLLIVEYAGVLSPEATRIAVEFGGKWFQELFDESIGFEVSALIRDPLAAARIESDFEQYAEIWYYNSRAPWSSESELTDQHRFARKTFYEVRQLEIEIYDLPEIQELYEKQMKDVRSRDKDAAIESGRQYQKVLDVHKRKMISEYQTRANIDGRVCELVLSEPTWDSGSSDNEGMKMFRERYDQWLSELTNHLGALELAPNEDGSVLGGYHFESLASGYVVQEITDSRLELGGMSFQRSSTGFAAFVRWLEKNGATDIRYSIYQTKE